METIETHGVAIPRLGLGTFRMPGDAARPMVESGLELGFRHIDTAAMYDNEAAVGAALAASGIKGADLFVTTKVWHDKLSPMPCDGPSTRALVSFSSTISISSSSIGHRET